MALAKLATPESVEPSNYNIGAMIGIESWCRTVLKSWTAPVFFHIARFYFASQGARGGFGRWNQFPNLLVFDGSSLFGWFGPKSRTQPDTKIVMSSGSVYRGCP
jgi:hypothetical protein